jgi:hypothetical protein
MVEAWALATATAWAKVWVLATAGALVLVSAVV